ncbi:P2X purinoceptor 7-like [Lineus longissimus]|uniref:P2X purinoceptor 7-like n=1 Tax=Lineus longissimus TaxID=88925 RepID=UPI00315D2CBE
MAGMSSSSSDEESMERREYGIQPYRFEPKRSAGQPQSDEEEREDEETPLTGGIDFAAQVTAHVSTWCTCDNCAGPLENPLMHFCCHELAELEDRLCTDDLDCILLHRAFEKCVLDKDVLRMTLVVMKDVKKASLTEPIRNRTYRLAAYRCFTWWTHDRLGRKVRKVIPSCVVVATRKRYPEPDGKYTGFREVDETDNTAHPD